MSSEEFCKCHEFFKRMDLNGSCTWDVSRDRLFIKYISMRKRGTCQKCMSTSTIRLLTLSFRRRGGSCPFKWEMSTQNRGIQTILGRLNLFYIGCGIMIFFSEHKNKEIKKKSPLQEKYLLFSNILILYNFFKKTVAWLCDNFEKDDDIGDFLQAYGNNGRWRKDRNWKGGGFSRT